MHAQNVANNAPAQGVSQMVRPLTKGIGRLQKPATLDEVAKFGWRLLNEDVTLPAAVLYEERLKHNLAWMQQFVSNYGAKFAPHGKTTMAPKLFLRQVQAGAWGITLATAVQTQVAHEHGIRRVLMANQLVGQENMRIISGLLEDSSFEFFCLVDSGEHVEQLGNFFRSRSQKLQVLLEIGVDGGRTGVRNREQLDRLLEAHAKFRENMPLVGVELFEGVLSDESTIRSFLNEAVKIASQLAHAGHFDRKPIILTGAGSSWYDVVAQIFSKADLGQAHEVVLRPGCYLTHDVGAYREAQQRIHSSNPIAQKMSSGLLPALQVWAYVHSVPEKHRAIVGLGKRDAAFDSGLPVPAFHYRPGHQKPTSVPVGWKLIRMMDQHAFLEFGEGSDIRVGDMISFDICHPCLTFDKWQYLLVVDKDFRVVDVVETFF
jgi:D-serine deaminase-like pyridoxal phosphate-dependent protein